MVLPEMPWEGSASLLMRNIVALPASSCLKLLQCILLLFSPRQCVAHCNAKRNRPYCIIDSTFTTSMHSDKKQKVVSTNTEGSRECFCALR